MPTSSIALRSRSLITILAMALGAALPAWANGTRFSSLQQFEACIKGYSHDECLVGLDVYLKKHSAQTFAAGKLIRKHFHATKALPYFAQAVKTVPAATLCADVDVQLAMEAGLFLPGDHENADVARKLFESTCFASTVSAVQKSLASDDVNRFLKENACPILQRKQLSAAACSALAASLPR